MNKTEKNNSLIAVVYMMTSQQDSALEGVQFSNMDMSTVDPSKMTPEQLEQLQNV